ncbi:hypothetical protein ABZV77_27695 [Streptomyces sp. NPDC004732]|uniref:hypothetical protein n=1 Tax=Streptomyces sp. NPDC004732 TaxID=3154290 RepID=UPI0033BE4ABB
MVRVAKTSRKQSAPSMRAEATFRARIAELGGEVLEEEWRGSRKPHRVRCAAGHESATFPSNVQQGHGICRTCVADMRSLDAETAFRARVAALGGVVLEEKWLGNHQAHRARCVNGHLCTPRPSHVQQGCGICSTCAGNDSRASEAAFRDNLAKIGARLLEPVYLGANEPHRVQCAAGHECRPRPAQVRRGDGICRACAGRDPQVAEANFRARIAELGGVVLEPVWLGATTPHRVRCAQGHLSAPWPASVQQGQGICRVCAGKDPKTAEAAFRARVTALGGAVLEPTWLGKDRPHRVRCAKGHTGTPTPSNVRAGGGICRTCAGKSWDVFYVVTDDINDVVKFGITSGNPRLRLSQHERDGFDHVVRLIEGNPEARKLENMCIAAMRDAGEKSARGREYFPIRTLGTILDIVDGWTAPVR